MKNLTKNMALTILLVIFKVLHVNYVTAQSNQVDNICTVDLIQVAENCAKNLIEVTKKCATDLNQKDDKCATELFLIVKTCAMDLVEVDKDCTTNSFDVDKNCAKPIDKFFEECKNDCVTVTQKIEFIFLYAVPNDLISPEERIVKEFTDHLKKAVLPTDKNQTPVEYCSKIKDAHLHGGCLKTIGSSDLKLEGKNVYDIYNLFTLNDAPLYHVWRYIHNVQRSVDINEYKLGGLDTPKTFCEMKKCVYDISIDMPSLAQKLCKKTPMDYGKYFMHTMEYNKLHNQISKDFVDYCFKAIDDSSISKMMTPEKFCQEKFGHLLKDCQTSIELHDLKSLDKKENFKHMFYNLTSYNTVKVDIEGQLIDFTNGYMQNTLEKIYLFNQKLYTISIEKYCTDVAVLPKTKYFS